MPVHNRNIINKLNDLADLLDIKGENEFRVRAYRNAARSLSGVTGNIAEMVNRDENISSLPGIGKSMSDKIVEIVKTGELKQLNELSREIPFSLIEIMKLEQMGAQRTKIISDKLKIKTVDELKKALEEGKIEKIKGFGKKISAKILKD